MADLPGGASGMLMRGWKGKADWLGTRIDPGVVALVAVVKSLGLGIGTVVRTLRERSTGS